MKDKTLLWNGAHLAVLSAFALAQPLFNLLSDNAEFFAARGSSAFDVISFSVLLVVVPPALLLAIEALVGLASEKARDIVHLVFIGFGVTLIAAQIFNDLFSATALIIGASVAVGAGLAVLYSRAEPVRSFLNVLSPAPLVFLVLFLFFSDVNKITLAGEASAKSIGGIARVPVVMVLFDELPSTSLLDEKQRIDAKRYPGFAELAGDSTWFRNAHAIYDSTSRAIPAIMDGNLPDKEKLPTSADHPNSIFTLLGKSHRMNVSEEATTVCPRDLCEDERLDESYASRIGSLTEDLGLVWLHVVSPPDVEEDLASVSDTWGDFGGGAGEAGATEGDDDQPNTRANLSSDRRARFEAWTDSIEDTRKPTLNFKHVLLPHVPWEYVPSGRFYRKGASEGIPRLSNFSFEDQGQIDQLYLRHLLQLRFTDMEVQRLIQHLKDIGIYDKALVVVAADHGVAFDLGERDRRTITEENLHEIAPVPLIIKRPGQEKGTVSDAYVETIDILPTIAEALNLRLPDKTDGVSAFSDAVEGRDEVRVLKRDFSAWIRESTDEYERLKQEQLDRKIELFGTGADGEQRMYQFGPNSELIGRSASGLEELPGAELVNGGDYEDVDFGSGYVPVHVLGRVDGGEPGQNIAIAVNGTIAAVSNTFQLAIDDETIFAAMIPESALREGQNEIQVLQAP
jgi:Sulfatase